MNFISRFIILGILSACLVSGASAYIINISAPESVFVGSPLVVTGATTFPEDSYFDLILFYSKHTAGEVKRQKVIVDKSKQFRSDFETRNMEKGQYKIEVQNVVSDGKEFVESELGSASVTSRVIQLTDRSDEITIESPETQNLSSALVITGKVKDMENGVITLRAFGPDDFTYGPEQIITKTGITDDDGHFSSQIRVTAPGEYQVSFSDKEGYIGEYPFTVTGSAGQENIQAVITPLPTTTTPTPVPTTLEPTTRAPTPTQAKSPLPAGIVVLGILAGFHICRTRK